MSQSMSSRPAGTGIELVSPTQAICARVDQCPDGVIHVGQWLAYIVTSDGLEFFLGVFAQQHLATAACFSAAQAPQKSFQGWELWTRMFQHLPTGEKALPFLPETLQLWHN